MSLWRKFVEPYVKLPDLQRWQAYLVPVLSMAIPFGAATIIAFDRGEVRIGMIFLVMAFLSVALMVWFRFTQIQIAKRIQEIRGQKPAQAPRPRRKKKRR